MRVSHRSNHAVVVLFALASLWVPAGEVQGQEKKREVVKLDKLKEELEDKKLLPSPTDLKIDTKIPMIGGGQVRLYIIIGGTGKKGHGHTVSVTPDLLKIMSRSEAQGITTP